MDLSRNSREDLLADLRRELGDGVVDFSPDNAGRDEALAMCGEAAMEAFFADGALSPAVIRDLFAAREAFPCFFGSGLKTEGIDEFLDAFTGLLQPRLWPEQFGARVFKISHDAQSVRLTHVKVTGGVLRVRDTLIYDGLEEKATQLRRYSGGKYTAVEEVRAGEVCAVVGLTAARNGQGFGTEAAAGSPVLEPVMHYRIGLPADTDPRLVLPKLKQLEAEDPMLRLRWEPRLQELSVGLMGEVQAEVLKSMILDRFDLAVELGRGRVLYKETIDKTVEGVGHYEPLRHYAEVHILLEPLPRGSGLAFAASCSEDRLDRHWQRLILTHLMEKEHLGTAIGAPITDVRLTLAAGKAHLKHTEGGDFRQATYRAVRQGLMQTPSLLLEPWYRFRLEVPTAQIGRAITDIKARFGSFETPEDLGGMSLLRGRAPVSAMTDYAREVAAYTRGLGKLALEVEGYDLCHDPEAVRAANPYDPEADLDNTPDSVFCAHGGGFTVKWDQVFANMHLESVLAPKQESVFPARRRISIDEKELQAILEREFGPIKRPQYSAAVWKESPETAPNSVVKSADHGVRPGEASPQGGRQYLIVDGFNVIFAWPELAALAQANLEQARERLMEMLTNYAAFTRTETVLVFDAYKVKGGRGERLDYHGVRVVYTKENETADAYIERLLHEIGKNEQVRLVTSDNLIQVSALRSGVLRQSAREFGEEIDRIYGEIERYLRSHNEQKLGTVGENLPVKK